MAQLAWTRVWLLCAMAIAVWPVPCSAIDAEAVSAANEGAVLLVVGDKAGRVVQGSGCCIEAGSGLVLTTAHQVSGVSEIRALSREGAEYRLEVLDVDEGLDLALLRADRSLPQAVRIADSGELRNGASVLSISSPKGIAFSTYTGTVTNVDFERDGHPVLLTDLPLTPGASGGPVFDRNGNLIGLVSGSVTEVDNTVVVPIDSAFEMLCAHGSTIAPCLGEGGEKPALAMRSGAPEAERMAVAAYNAGVEAGSPAQKIVHYLEATRHFPAFYEAWFNLGVAYTAAGDLTAAAAAYEKALAQNSNAARTHRNLGLVYLRAGRLGESTQQLEQAVKLAPKDERAHNDLGEAYRRSERLEDAAATFRKALELKADYPVARYNLALTYAQLGANQKAIAEFKRYLALSPNADDAGQVRAWIEKLQDGER